MTVCFLGSRKLRKIEVIIGEPVKQACVRGGWDHYWASVQSVSGDYMVNYKTGEVEPSRFARYVVVIENGQEVVRRDGPLPPNMRKVGVQHL